MLTMYEVMKNAITHGGYKLLEVQQRIKRLYALGDLTEEQMDELMQLAADGASADAERPSDTEMIMSLAEMVAALEARLEALEGSNDNSGGDDPGEEEKPEYPAWKPWDGISNDYQYGAIVSHNEQLWISVFNGHNVWEPGLVGENLWKPYSPEDEQQPEQPEE